MIRPVHYCPACGSAEVSWRVPAEDDRERHVCEACGEIHYQNPRNVAGCIAEHAGRILLCRRAIEPRLGYWTVPAGFMENHETLAQAAARETAEEACAETAGLALYALFNLPHISQVYVLFRAGVPGGRAAAGPESLEVGWFEERDIPWAALAFPVVREGLRLYLADRRDGHFPVRMGDILPRGAGGYEVRHHGDGA
ncbi:MAG: NUDIX hydrolase [Halofilum sp. (in: g-proteobacteria)]|nr:NUDIX hydrolase [Halofilum sp. (in: g-proteobacteria)]